MIEPKDMWYYHSTYVEDNSANLLQVLSMCNAFKDQNDIKSVRLYLMKSLLWSKRADELRVHNHDIDIKFIYIPRFFGGLARYIFSFVLIPSYLRALRNYQFSRNIFVVFLAYCFSKTVIFEVHNNKLHNKSLFMDMLMKRMLRVVARNDNNFFIVVISNALERYWNAEGISINKIVTLHDGFDEKQFAELPSKHQARIKVGWAHDKEVAVYTGNIRPNRGVEKIIEMASEFSEIEFYIIGGPEQFIGRLSKIIETNNVLNVYLLGEVNHDDIPCYLSAADILIAIWSNEVPTINYCSPLKVFEYLAAGRPILAHGYDSVKEVLKDGRNAILARPDKLVDLSEGFRRLLNYDKEKLSINAKRDSKEFTWQKRAERIVSKYGEN
jgi:glycosyltransferase involved in cell wall biosynthesis